MPPVSVPRIGNIRYEPSREISRPLTIDVTSIPPIIGSSCIPACDGVGLHDLQVERNERDRAEQRDADDEADQADQHEGAMAEQFERHDRLGREPLRK